MSILPAADTSLSDLSLKPGRSSGRGGQNQNNQDFREIMFFYENAVWALKQTKKTKTELLKLKEVKCYLKQKQKEHWLKVKVGKC